ncbi:MAG: tRNA lysidine(34) synthetase TilS [Campylobacterota bacterium]|nr:tRNA lysidine(34) synthetase TilS [Campylobacterota bacterium]
MLKSSSLKQLRAKKNLLAFSAGVDSSALFFILLQNKIEFDIAIVNYNTRKQSQDELAYAEELASAHKLICHSLNAEMIEKNFEAQAREIRYSFFEELIAKHQYENLITAHHLGDRFEWMLMQFCKGAGCAELTGMQELQKRDNYTLARPLLHLDKQELLAFLETNRLKYFIDESNLDRDIKRNSFRHNYSSPLLEKYLSGIKKSFEYLDEDRDILINEVEIHRVGEFAYFKSSKNIRNDIFTLDKYLKSKQYMLSANERELLKNETTLVVGRKFVVNQEFDFVFIAPFTEFKVMPKEFKEKMRLLKIEPKLRTYLFDNEDAAKVITQLLS